jgi:arylsulfatase A-like enzyme/Flp pilus assembly protein TadD
MRMAICRIFFCLLALLIADDGSPAGSKSSANILLITVDTLRADRLKCYGYSEASTPEMDQLAAEGFRFERAYAQVPLTLPSHYSILSGTYPFYHGVRDNSQPVRNGPTLVSEVLQRNGYRTGAFVGSFILDSRFGLKRGFDLYGDDFDVARAHGSDLSHIERPAEEVVQKALRWITESKGKFFAWVHLFDPHDPYSPPEPFKSRFARSPYDGEIAYVDYALGILFKSLKAKGLWENTHILLIGDHGEGLGEHGELNHGFFVYDSTLHVPLIIRPTDRPGKGRSIDLLVQSVDIAPTVLRLVGLQPPQEMQGQSLLGLMGSTEDNIDKKLASNGRSAYFETFYPLRQFGWSELRGIRTERYKYIDAPRAELYDMLSDAGEKQNLYKHQQALAGSMKEMLRKHLVRYASEHPPRQEVSLNPDTRERLQSLGYIAYTKGNAQGPASVRADPKDKFGVYSKILEGLALANRGQSALAAKVLEEALNEAPEATSARMILGVQYEKLGDFNKASQLFARALADDPRNGLASFDLAQSSAKLGKTDEAISWYQRTLEVDPGFSMAHTALGIIYRDRRQWPQAIEQFEKALACGPDSAAYYNLSGIFALQGHLDQALKEAEEAIKLQPNQAEYHGMLGSVYLLRKQMPEAERAYLRAIELNPRSAPALVNLAKVYTETGQLGKARICLQQAMKLDPSQGAARRMLDQLERQERKQP